MVPSPKSGEYCGEPAPIRTVRLGFTLLELMASIGILVLLVAVVHQLVSSATLSTVSATRLMDSDNQARLIFAKMAEDFASMYRRADVNYYFKSQSGNDAFYFYSQAPGHIASQEVAGTTDASINSASLVGYRVSDSVSGGTRVELERLGRGLRWMDLSAQAAENGAATSVQHLPSLIKNAFSQAIADVYNNTTNPSTSASATNQWDVIGDQVFRMEFCFLLRDGTFSLKPVLAASTNSNNLEANAAPTTTADSSAGYGVGSRWYDTTTQIAYQCTNAAAGAAVWAPQGLADVKAVVVTLALIDTKSRVSTGIASIRNAISSLSDTPATNPGSMQKTWVQKANDTASLVRETGLNRTTASSVRVYERFFYLN